MYLTSVGFLNRTDDMAISHHVIHMWETEWEVDQLSTRDVNFYVIPFHSKYGSYNEY